MLAWFRLNSSIDDDDDDRDEETRDYLYADIEKFFKWEKGGWVRRTGVSHSLGRLMHVNPSPRNMELFHLRILLLNIRGARGWEDLLTVNGVVHPTFEDACKAHGLNSDVGQGYDAAFRDVVKHGTANQKFLRRTCSTVCFEKR